MRTRKLLVSILFLVTAFFIEFTGIIPVLLPWICAAQTVRVPGPGGASAASGITATNTGNGLCAGGAAGGTISLGNTAATGNFIVVTVAYQGTTPTVGADSFGNTYTGVTATGGVTPPVGKMFYSANANGGSSHTVPFTATFGGACAIVFTGLTATPFDKEVHLADQIGTSAQPGSVALAGTPSLVITTINGGVPTGIDSSFINSGIIVLTGGSNYANAVYYKITSTTENPIVTLSTSANWSGQNAVFK